MVVVPDEQGYTDEGQQELEDDDENVLHNGNDFICSEINTR